ncbi:hypothetical protein GALMADRAFT_209000 [Galerina marginata CBS 339.88]|uniref:Uncharacterized protein n=1 Tax=Galerina marginata (strain CBS 339.88) TaxID=685588 RepID=A0A067T5X3_GALM3|nr:hypothetical protein GALMADRAFT_209000 [Galerina marginata CBS 339.88]
MKLSAIFDEKSPVERNARPPALCQELPIQKEFLILSKISEGLQAGQLKLTGYPRLKKLNIHPTSARHRHLQQFMETVVFCIPSGSMFERFTGHLAAAPSPYDDCVSAQLASTELFVYSPTAGQCTVIAWPTYQRRAIQPDGIKKWLRSRMLHWSCFCSLITSTSTSTRIVEALNGDIFVFCHEYPSVCGFSLNLSEVFKTAQLFSEYDHLPTIDAAVARGPYFEGYCGEHQLDHPGITQLSGGHLSSNVFGAEVPRPKPVVALNLIEMQKLLIDLSRLSPLCSSSVLSLEASQQPPRSDHVI